jgi:HEAT repeat protein
MSSDGIYLNRTAQQWADAMRDTDSLMRRLAAYALGEIGPAARDVVPALAAALQDEASFVRTWAAAALARVEPTNTTAIAALGAAAADERPFVRSLAVWHLGRLGPDAPGLADLMPSVEKLLEDPDPSVRAEAGLALQRLRQERCFRAH